MTLKTLRLQFRFLLPLALALVAAAYLAVPLMDQVTLRWFSRDLNSRGVLVTNALSDSVALALAEDRPARLQALFARAVQDERLVAIGLCSADGRMLQRSDAFPPTLSCAGGHQSGGRGRAAAGAGQRRGACRRACCGGAAPACCAGAGEPRTRGDPGRRSGQAGPAGAHQ